MTQVSAQYLAAGANRHPSAADWDVSGVLAYGADRNIALWRPLNSESKGVYDLLGGHTETVNAVKFVPKSNGLLLSGGVDKTLRIWSQSSPPEPYSCMQTLSDHKGSINCIAAPNRSSGIFASGAADETVRIWQLDDKNAATLRQTITIKPRFFPLALALHPLPGAPESYVLAVAGTKDIIQLYILDSQTSPDFKLQATLSGHEGWIRSLEFTKEKEDSDSDLILSSASQDKYIRLWRIHQGTELPAAAANQDPSLGAFMPGKSLSNRAHRFQAQGLDFSATFEALLLGHEDWIYSTKWRSSPGTDGRRKLQLLSASADNSLAIWEADSSTGVWVTTTRLGEISAEKGSTTATGSTGGFWTGLWSPCGTTLVCLGRTGSWRLWNHSLSLDRWISGVGISGHTLPVLGISWSPSGSYLLSTSTDQTTRLHANWKQVFQGEEKESWHEIARPQIHGYDLNCVSSLTPSTFISGADEKLLRVFSIPKAVAKLLTKLTGLSPEEEIDSLPDAANMPVLGLSNKAIEAVSDDYIPQAPSTTIKGNDPHNTPDPLNIIHKSTLDLNTPPSEEHLSRHTLFPEIEKLYGHGYEISCLATSHDGTLVATACKATSLDHAVIRIFETKTWGQVKPPLTAHSLTISRLRFSRDDRYLLSVGRDRQWAIFSRDTSDSNNYTLLEKNPKGHSRMVLDAAWAPNSEVDMFATAGRDKLVKIWVKGGEEGTSWTLGNSITEEGSVTAVDFLDVVVGGFAYLAVGTEMGKMKVYSIEMKQGFAIKELDLVFPSTYPFPSKSITQLAWKPIITNTITNTSDSENRQGETKLELAIASQDSSLRVYSIGPLIS